MTSEDNIDSIFCQAVEIALETQRREYLARACGANVELRARLDKLLAAHAQAGSFMPEGEQPTLNVQQPTFERPGGHIGPYKLRELLGEGGMGVVWAAEQKKPLRRRVAVKVIKPGMDSSQVIARFEVEREALALMDHPNIARVLDAGTTEQGRLYFVMELIRGTPITEYCDAHKLPVRERLRLFINVCRAVQHAHQKGIIHRDIKPSNVLVTEQDGNPVPKVIDFGVAKALHHSLTDRSIYTGVFQAVGTLTYMSPEQATLSDSTIDTRADVYGLGVLLYELLTGRTPLDRQRLESAALDEACRLIREQEPPKPSTKISTLGEEAESVSEGRRTDPKALNKSVRGELDWIVMKAMEKDRRRRYETAEAFASDVRHFLNDDPVAACPPSKSYRIRKFTKRNKYPIAVAFFLLLILLAGFGVTSWQWIHTRQTLVALQGELKQKSLTLAMSGDREAAERAIERAVAAGASPSWARVLNGIVAIYSGDCPTGIRILTDAKADFETGEPMSVAARSGLVIANMFEGRTGQYVREVVELLPMEPKTPEGCILKALAVVPLQDQDDYALELVDQYFERHRASAVGLMIRSMVRATIARRTDDTELMESACFDSLLACELMPQGSNSALTFKLFAHSEAYTLYKSLGRTSETDRFRDIAVSAANALRYTTGQMHAQVHAALFLENIGELDAARIHWQLAQGTGLRGYYLADHAMFECRHTSTKTAVDLLQDDAKLCFWSTCLRGILMLEVPGKRGDAIADLRGLAPGPITELHVLAVGALIAAGETPEPIHIEHVRSTLDFGDSPKYENDALSLLLGTLDPKIFTSRYAAEENTAHVYLALRVIGDGSPIEDALEHLRCAAESTELSIYGQLSRTLIACLKRNSTWPHPVKPQ